MATEGQLRAVRAISRRKKERFLLQMSEADFRDTVVRPLLLRRGLTDGRDTCGTTEEGKDALFIASTRLGTEDLYAVQTKKGSLNLSSSASQNVTQATVQLRTALLTTVLFLPTRSRKLPAKAILCASGKINSAARKHIAEQLNDPRLEFLDSDDLIPWIDEDYSELWFGIDAALQPYLRALKRQIENVSDNLIAGDLIPTMKTLSTVADDMFVPLKVGRTTLRPRRRKGEVEMIPHYEEIPATALLQRRDTLAMVAGEAGSGKSTLLRRLAYVLAGQSLQSEERPTIPILLRCADVAERPEPLVELAAEHTQRVANQDRPSFSVSELRLGKVAFFIDALDEVAEQRLRQRIVDRINVLHGDYPLCRVILTTRQLPFLATMFDTVEFARWELAPFTHSQAEQILTRLYTKRRLPKEACKEILRRLEQVHGVELNPLLITVFAATTDYARRDIPANITELFKKFTEIMLGRWDSTKGLAQQYEATVKDFLLGRVGFEMHRRGVTRIDRAEFEKMISSILESRGLQLDSAAVARELFDRSGLLRVFEDSIEFRHLLLQEFFAGRGIPSLDFLDTVAAGSTWWLRAMVFYFGEHPQDASGLRRLMGCLGPRPGMERYTGAVGLGLALQACYLAEVGEKEEIFRWVVAILSGTRDEVLVAAQAAGRHPTLAFLAYYLFGRDAVAASLLATGYQRILADIRKESTDSDDDERRNFWVVAGLIEAGLLREAEEAVRAFRPRDKQLLLAIHLGSLLAQELRAATREQKAIAARISHLVGNQIADLRKQVIRELRSELLEVQKGDIVAIKPQ